MNTTNRFLVAGRTRYARWLASALVAIIGLLAAAGGVVAHRPDPVLAGSRWTQDQVVTFAWRRGNPPATALRPAILAAAADVTASRASQAASFRYDPASVNPIGYGQGVGCTTIGIACFTRHREFGTQFTMWFREQGHVFDWGVLKWCQAYVTRPRGCFDVENIALDEFGHVESLNHHTNFENESDYEDAVVQAGSKAYPEAGWNKHAFGRCDVASLQTQYDVRTWAAKYSTCLALSTTLGLSSSASHVAVGGSVAITATLKVADDPSYGRLSVNPLPGRFVLLQRRVPGTSAWSTVGPMTSGLTAGTYTRTFTLTTAMEFRAIFNTPSDEGLRASTSPALRIAVP